MIPSMNAQMGMPQQQNHLPTLNPTQTQIPIPQQQQSEQQHQHSAQCKHNHSHSQNSHHHHSNRNYNPFSNVPNDMRVFVWHSIIAGDFFFQIFMQLPMMGQGYFLYQMIQQNILYPFYYLNSIFNSFFGDNFLRKIVGGFAIYYYLFHGMLFYFNMDTYQEKDLLIYLQIIILVLYSIILFIPPGFFQQLEFQQLIEEKPELMMLTKQNRNQCILCQIPKVARSQHCIYCQKCVKKWETHSTFFNCCIGVYNYPFYLLFLGLVTLYLFFTLRQFILPRQVQKSYIDLIAVLFTLQQLYYFGQQFLLCVVRITYNVTFNEIQQWRRYSYLWKNEKGQFGNPFDKGIILNWVQFIKPLITKSGEFNWGQMKILNLTDIPGHPLSELANETIQKQIQKLRQHEKMAMKSQEQAETTRLLDEQ